MRARPALRSVAIGALVAAGVAWTGLEASTLARVWVAGFLFLAVESDVRAMRIPNWLTFATAGGALLYHGVWATGSGAGFALLGAGGAFAVLWIPYATNGLGAGDVKAAIALGTLLGWPTIAGVLVWSLLAGGSMALLSVLAGRGLFSMLRRWRDSLALTTLTRSPVWIRPEAGSAAAGAIPFALSLGLGTVASQCWGAPWA